MKKILAVSAAAVGVAAVALFTSQSVVNPQPFLACGFVSANGDWVSDDWTNYFSVEIFATRDLQNWREISPELQIVNGHLSFVVPMTNGAEFYRAQFIPLP